MVIGYEVGKDGTPHLQGYVCMKKTRTLPAMKKIMPRAHLELMKGTPEQAAEYCKKDGKFDEKGTFPVYRNKDTNSATKKRNADYALAVELAKRQKALRMRSWHAPPLWLFFSSNDPKGSSCSSR